MNIVSNRKMLVLIDARFEVVLGDLDLFSGKLVVVVGVEIERSNNIAEGLQVGLAIRTLACRIRWTHVGWVFTNNVADSHFVLGHLIITLLLSDCIKILMTPSVTSNLMAICLHFCDHITPVLINGAFANVITSDEESGTSTSSLELGHDLFSVDVWAIIIGYGDNARLGARSNAQSTICNAT